jgi:hypothetical protein
MIEFLDDLVGSAANDWAQVYVVLAEVAVDRALEVDL